MSLLPETPPRRAGSGRTVALVVVAALVLVAAVVLVVRLASGGGEPAAEATAAPGAATPTASADAGSPAPSGSAASPDGPGSPAGSASGGTGGGAPGAVVDPGSVPSAPPTGSRDKPLAAVDVSVVIGPDGTQPQLGTYYLRVGGSYTLKYAATGDAVGRTMDRTGPVAFQPFTLGVSGQDFNLLSEPGTYVWQVEGLPGPVLTVEVVG